jgi:N-acetylmuramoyl-L-alanine amidase
MLNINHSFKSPNFSERDIKSQNEIDTIVIHHTNLPSLENSIERLCNIEAQVSSHYIISNDGEIYQLVDDLNKAWHAGISYWRGKENLNNFSIGIELDNIGTAPFPEKQMQSLMALCLDLQSKFSIDPFKIIAHYDIAPDRKDDPNHYFNWKLLAENGIGIFPKTTMQDPKHLFKLNDQDPLIYNLKTSLNNYGYKINNLNQIYDEELAQVIIAFKRHFVPETFGSEFWDELAQARLEELLALNDQLYPVTL